MVLASKVVKIDLKIIISSRESKSMPHSVVYGILKENVPIFVTALFGFENLRRIEDVFYVKRTQNEKFSFLQKRQNAKALVTLAIFRLKDTTIQEQFALKNS